MCSLVLSLVEDKAAVPTAHHNGTKITTIPTITPQLDPGTLRPLALHTQDTGQGVSAQIISPNHLLLRNALKLPASYQSIQGFGYLVKFFFLKGPLNLWSFFCSNRNTF